jgi:hypothetical protein
MAHFVCIWNYGRNISLYGNHFACYAQQTSEKARMSLNEVVVARRNPIVTKIEIFRHISVKSFNIVYWVQKCQKY